MTATGIAVDPVGTADIAERYGISRSAVDRWRERYDDFPKPRWRVSGNPVWQWSDVEAWHERFERETTHQRRGRVATGGQQAPPRAPSAPPSTAEPPSPPPRGRSNVTPITKGAKR